MDKVEKFVFRGMKPLDKNKTDVNSMQQEIDYASIISTKIDKIFTKLSEKATRKVLIYKNTVLYTNKSIECFSDADDIVFLTEGGYVKFSYEDTIEVTITTKETRIEIELQIIK